MKIRSIKVYQSVLFEKSMESSFSVHFIPHKAPVSLEYKAELGMIEVKSEKDHILIPLSNISAIHLWVKEDDERVKHLDNEMKKAVTNSGEEVKKVRK